MTYDSYLANTIKVVLASDMPQERRDSWQLWGITLATLSTDFKKYTQTHQKTPHPTSEMVYSAACLPER